MPIITNGGLGAVAIPRKPRVTRQALVRER